MSGEVSTTVSVVSEITLRETVNQLEWKLKMDLGELGLVRKGF